MSEENVKPEVAEEPKKVEYQELPIEAKNMALKRLAEKIKQAGFNFHPGKILAELDKEAERQFAEICKDILKGQSIKSIMEIQGEVYEWMNSEDERFAAFKRVNQEEAVEQAGALPVFSPVETETVEAPVDGEIQYPVIEDDAPVEKFKVEYEAKKAPSELNSSHIPVTEELPKSEKKSKGNKKK